MINEHYTPEAVILANGEYPTCPVPLTMLEEASFVACCDRKRTTRLKPSGICKREDSGELPLSERPANGKTIHWEISAYCWII